MCLPGLEDRSWKHVMSCFGQVRSSMYKKLGTVLRAGQGFPLVSQRPNCKTLWSLASKMPWLHHRLDPESIFFRMCCIVNVGWKIYKIVCNSIYLVGGFQAIWKILWKPGCLWKEFEITTVISFACFPHFDARWSCRCRCRCWGTMKRRGLVTEELV